MKKMLARLICFLLRAAWTLARLLAVVWAVEFAMARLCKREEHG